MLHTLPPAQPSPVFLLPRLDLPLGLDLDLSATPAEGIRGWGIPSSLSVGQTGGMDWNNDSACFHTHLNSH